MVLSSFGIIACARCLTVLMNMMVSGLVEYLLQSNHRAQNNSHSMSDNVRSKMPVEQSLFYLGGYFQAFLLEL
jgi:hypothetical protein